MGGQWEAALYAALCQSRRGDLERDSVSLNHGGKALFLLSSSASM